MKKILNIVKIIAGIFFAIEAISGTIILITHAEVISNTSNLITTLAMSLTFAVLAYFCLRRKKSDK